MSAKLRTTKTLLSSTLITALALSGCSEDDSPRGGNLDAGTTVPDSGNNGGGNSGNDGGTSTGNDAGSNNGINTLDGGIDAAVSTANALYAVPSEVYGVDFNTSTSYVPLVPSLDVASISIKDAREIEGRATVARVGK